MRRRRIQGNKRTFSDIWRWDGGCWWLDGHLGDTLGRETCLYGGTIISYLLGSDSLCLTLGNPLYYRTSINKRKRKKLSMNKCKAVHECQHQTLAMSAVQTGQYEFKHTPSLLEMTEKRTGQTNPCAPLTTRLTQKPERESEGGEIKL